MRTGEARHLAPMGRRGFRWLPCDAQRGPQWCRVPGNAVVPSPWQATSAEVRAGGVTQVAGRDNVAASEPSMAELPERSLLGARLQPATDVLDCAGVYEPLRRSRRRGWCSLRGGASGRR